MKKSSILLTVFLLLSFGVSFLSDLQSKKMAVSLSAKQDIKTTTSMELFKVLNHRGDWKIIIKQGLIPGVKTIITRENYDSISVVVRNDTLFASNHRGPDYWQQYPRTSAVLEITLGFETKDLSVISQSDSKCFYTVNQVNMENLSFNSGFQSEIQIAHLRIEHSSITNLKIAFDFVNRFNYYFLSDTIENTHFKLCGNVSAGRDQNVWSIVSEEESEINSRPDSCFKNSIMTNYYLDCFGCGRLDLASAVPGKITGQINGTVKVIYPTVKNVTDLMVKGASKASAKLPEMPHSIIDCGAKMFITSNPVYLPVFIDSSCFGRTNEQLSLPTGTHHLRIKSGSKTFDTTITLKKGTNKGFNVDLR